MLKHQEGFYVEPLRYREHDDARRIVAAGLSHHQRIRCRISLPSNPRAILIKRGEHTSRIIERHMLRERLASLCKSLPLEMILLVCGERFELFRYSGTRPDGHSQSIIPIIDMGDYVVELEVSGVDVNTETVAAIAAQWIGDVFQLEDEMGSLVQEIVHSYEELHLLYYLGEALGATLDVTCCLRINRRCTG